MTQPGRTPALPPPLALAAMLFLAVATWAIAGLALLGESRPASAETVEGLEFEVAYPSGEGWRTVELHLLVLHDGTRDREALAAEARQAALERFPGGVIVEPEVTAQFVTLEWAWPDDTAAWGYNGANEPAHLPGAAGVFRDSARTWNEAGSPFRFTGGDATTAQPGLCSGALGTDGENTVAWDDLGGSTLAMTCFDSLTDAAEFDMIFDRGRDWTVDPEDVEIDLQTVATHEFGHALGLNHPCRSGASCDESNAVMYSPYTRGELKRELARDDRKGLVAIYGSEVAQEITPTPSPTPTATPTPSPTPTPTPGAPLERRDVVPGLTRSSG